MSGEMEKNGVAVIIKFGLKEHESTKRSLHISGVA
tara:strand:+ start:514 stop:618 length:105 start_codon:yes stop_codon:yes gene_type:complete